jgi:hypothetical protein
MPTVVEGGPHGGTTIDGGDEKTHVDTRQTHTSFAGTTMDLPKPETVLRRAEIEQSKRTAISALVFNTLGLLCTPLFGGDPVARQWFIAGLVFAWLVNAGLLYVSWKAERYRERHVVIYFLLAPFFNSAVMYYVGVFGPILVIFVLNLYSVCLGYGRRVALVTLAACIAPMLFLGTPMALGWLHDPGLITLNATIGLWGRLILVFAFILFLFLTYAQARSARDVMVASLVERDDAVRRASHREALFIEARQELENALRAGGLGRFTDQVLGSYKLGAVLGRGGMGEVYEAAHVDSNEVAAVKLLLPEMLGQADYVRRFMREVRIVAALDSPHVVRVLEVGDEKAPLPYLAMERLYGEDLAAILRRKRRMRPPKVLELIRQVGRGIATASKDGIVHRDLKPQNLFLTEDKPPVWKILDFGVSKRIDGDSTLTRGETVGTPHYMAPEQARGGDVDGLTDLYALGAVAYRALTGYQPFTGTDIAHIMMQVISDMPARPSGLVDVHEDVDLALAIALAKTPDSRYEDAEELADALGAALRGKLGDDYKKRARVLLDELPYDNPS